MVGKSPTFLSEREKRSNSRGTQKLRMEFYGNFVDRFDFQPNCPHFSLER